MKDFAGRIAFGDGVARASGAAHQQVAEAFNVAIIHRGIVAPDMVRRSA